jgi:hypothetical protein
MRTTMMQTMILKPSVTKLVPRRVNVLDIIVTHLFYDSKSG